MFFTRQKQVVEDKDDAISQIRDLVDQKLEEQVEGEENKKILADHKKRWVEISVKYR